MSLYAGTGKRLNGQWHPDSQSINGSQLEIPITIEAVIPISSYSWIKTKDKPLIVIPGCPPIWNQNQTYPFFVPPDQGRPYGDPNLNERIKSPLEPFFLSVKVEQPDFDFSLMDVITDRTIFRKLLRWTSAGGKRTDFRIDAQLLKDSNTLFLSAYEADRKYSEGLTRKNFEIAMTNIPTGWKNTYGHHRIVSYKLGDVQMLVRTPEDAINSELEEDPIKSLNCEGLLENSFDHIEGPSGLSYIKAGCKFPLEATMELIVRNSNSRNAQIQWNDVWHQLYFAQASKLVLAYHDEGRFKEPIKYFMDTSPELLSEVENAQPFLKSLVRTLKAMKKMTLQQREQYNIISFFFPKDKRRGVEVYECKSESQLPSGY